MAPPRALNPGRTPLAAAGAAPQRSHVPTGMLPPKTSHVLQSSRAPAQLSLFLRPVSAR